MARASTNSRLVAVTGRIYRCVVPLQESPIQKECNTPPDCVALPQPKAVKVEKQIRDCARCRDVHLREDRSVIIVAAPAFALRFTGHDCAASGVLSHGDASV